jgi:hypothetical protein
MEADFIWKRPPNFEIARVLFLAVLFKCAGHPQNRAVSLPPSLSGRTTTKSNGTTSRLVVSVVVGNACDEKAEVVGNPCVRIECL